MGGIKSGKYSGKDHFHKPKKGKGSYTRDYEIEDEDEEEDPEEQMRQEPWYRRLIDQWTRS